jgi:hypothetical protein
MFGAQCDFAAVVYGVKDTSDRLLLDFTEDLRRSGVRIAGLVQLDSWTGQSDDRVVRTRGPRPKRAQGTDYLATMTSEAFIIAHASSPTFRPRSATASLVMEAVRIDPCPTSMLTCDVVAPVFMSTTLS